VPHIEQDTSDRLLPVDEVAARFGATVAAIRKWTRQGKLRPVRLGRLVRYRLTEVERVMAEGL
jgi:excisionase family DNA binding protein